MGLLCGWPRWEAGVTKAFPGGDPEKFFAAEIRRMLRASGLEGENDAENQKDAENMAQRLLQLVYPVKRIVERIGDPPKVQMNTERMGMDGLLLALFLSTDGKERDHGAMEASR
jgi:hypothetical protein